MRSPTLYFAALAGLGLGVVGVLGFRISRRQMRFRGMQHQIAELHAEHQQLDYALAQQKPVAVTSKAEDETGFFQAELAPATGFRRMTWGEDKDGNPRVAYVAPLPDLVPGDFVGAGRTERALMAVLTEAGQARVAAIADQRSTAGGSVNEAFLVDGKLIYVNPHFERLRTKSIPVIGIEFAEKDFVKRFVAEVSAAHADR